MKLARIRLAEEVVRIAIWDDEGLHLLKLTPESGIQTLADILHSPDPQQTAARLVDPDAEPLSVNAVELLAPICQQEVWAAGVTYKRSQVARMEESESGASHYDKVYTADRPELFLKATPNRVSGPHQPLRVRADSQWSVPEPELALVVNPAGQIVGYTVGNDMSARDIEGENPLYLPQAKVYNQCCGLGPCIFLPDADFDPRQMTIELTIERQGAEVFRGSTAITEMARELPELVGWMTRENDIPNGAFLLTGTGVVPDDSFTLVDGDLVTIEISSIGALTNPIVQATR